MSLVFFCQGCGTRFEVSEAMAGKAGRCKHCGQRNAIPRSVPVAAPAVTLARAPVAVGAVASGVSPFTDVGLAPLTAEELAPAPRKKAARWLDPLADADDSKPYLLAVPEDRTPAFRPASPTAPVSRGTILWRRALLAIQRPFRWLNDAAYLVSVPFLMLILVGAIGQSRPLALLGALGAVLLNLGRLGTGLVNLVLVPFRAGVLQGLLFLVPPLTVLYLARNWGRMKKATLRVVEPAVTIGLVVVAFTFVPSLRRPGAAPASGDFAAQLREGADDLGADLRTKIDKVEAEGLQALDPRAQGPDPGTGKGTRSGPGRDRR